MARAAFAAESRTKALTRPRSSHAHAHGVCRPSSRSIASGPDPGRQLIRLLPPRRPRGSRVRSSSAALRSERRPRPRIPAGSSRHRRHVRGVRRPCAGPRPQSAAPLPSSGAGSGGESRSPAAPPCPCSGSTPRVASTARCGRESARSRRRNVCPVSSAPSSSIRARTRSRCSRSKRHRFRVERYPPHLVRLGVLLDADAAMEDVVPADLDRLGVEVDISPPEGADLASPHAGRHHQPHERAPVVVERERRVEQPRGIGG